jgi:ADP-heptose:LPS heptosyltransferase
VLLEGNPYIDEILLNDRKGGWMETLRLCGRLRKERFSAVLDFMGNPRSAILARVSGAPVRISYEARERGFLYTHRVRHPQGIEYAVEIKKRLLEPLGIRSARNRPEVYLSEAGKAGGKALRERRQAGCEARDRRPFPPAGDPDAGRLSTTPSSV